MVRVISASNLGFGDFGGGISDRCVDGIVWEQDDFDYLQVQLETKAKSKIKPKKVEGGQNVTVGRVQIK